MTLLLLTPALLSLLVFCAHLFRSGAFLLVPLVLFLLPLLFIPKGWVARLFQVVLVFAAAEWVRVAVFLASERQEAGKPWLRMVIILGVVAAFSLFSAFLLEMPTLQRLYPRRFR